jgi:hemerythrin superfamily protein
MPKLKQMDITELLHNDHQTVRELFFAFSKAEEDAEKEKLVQQILAELFIHAKVEEEIVYPLLDKEGEEGEDFHGEAENEHRLVKFLMAEISQLDAGSDELKAKITVLCELVEHHVKEEEKDMFKMLRESGNDLEAVAEEVNEMKAQLKRDGLPTMKVTLEIGDESEEDDDDETEGRMGNSRAKAKQGTARKMTGHKPGRKSA